METFKIELFVKEHNSPFPFYENLHIGICNKLKSDIIQKFNLDNKDLDKEVFDLLKYCDFVNATENFNLKDILLRLEIVPNDVVYLDWSSFDGIDVINVNDLTAFFYDIWYPVADDINIFDETLSWLVYIRHDGAVYYLKNS